MAIDISQYTNQIASAIYGRDVRSSIVNGLLACANTAGLEILGSYDTLADLEVAHPTGNEGDYYLAGLDLYYWINSAWSKVCQFKGTGVKSIAKTSTSGLVDTYTITYNDSTTSTFTVTNGFSPTATVVQNADNSITVTITDKNGTTTATVPAGSYTLPVATATTLGGVKIGTGVSATADGTLSADVTSVNGNTGAVTVTDITGNAATATTATDYAASGAIATALASKAGLSADEQTITLAASSWDSTAHTITVSVTGVTATSNQDILPLLATSTANITNNTNLSAAGIYDYGQAAGTITLYATTVPTTDLQVRVIVRGD